MRERKQLANGGKKLSADGTWNVTLNSPMGAQAGTLELASDGNTLTGSIIDGDQISGEAKLGAFGTATFEGSRA